MKLKISFILFFLFFEAKKIYIAKKNEIEIKNGKIFVFLKSEKTDKDYIEVSDSSIVKNEVDKIEISLIPNDIVSINCGELLLKIEENFQEYKMNIGKLNWKNESKKIQKNETNLISYCKLKLNIGLLIIKTLQKKCEKIILNSGKFIGEFNELDCKNFEMNVGVAKVCFDGCNIEFLETNGKCIIKTYGSKLGYLNEDSLREIKFYSFRKN